MRALTKQMEKDKNHIISLHYWKYVTFGTKGQICFDHYLRNIFPVRHPSSKPAKLKLLYCTAPTFICKCLHVYKYEMYCLGWVSFHKLESHFQYQYP